MAPALVVTFLVLFSAAILMQRRAVATASADERARYSELANGSRVHAILGLLLAPLMLYPSSDVVIGVAALSVLWAGLGSVWEQLWLRRRDVSRGFRMRLVRARFVGIVAVATLATSAALLAH